MSAIPSTRRALLAGMGASVALLSTPAKAGYRVSTFDWTQIELMDDYDRRFNVDQLYAPWIVIKLWANWCSACMRELDTVADIAPILGAANVDVVMISHPDDWARNQQVTRTRNLQVRTARPAPTDNPALLQAGMLDADGDFYVPRTLLFDKRDRTIVWSHMGGVDWSTPEAVAPLRRWIG